MGATTTCCYAGSLALVCEESSTGDWAGEPASASTGTAQEPSGQRPGDNPRLGIASRSHTALRVSAGSRMDEVLGSEHLTGTLLDPLTHHPHACSSGAACCRRSVTTRRKRPGSLSRTSNSSAFNFRSWSTCEKARVRTYGFICRALSIS